MSLRVYSNPFLVLRNRTGMVAPREFHLFIVIIWFKITKSAINM